MLSVDSVTAIITTIIAAIFIVPDPLWHEIITGIGIFSIVDHSLSMPEVGTRLYKLLTVCGADATEFLQGQLTQDVGRIASGDSLPAAWCNARGRVIATMRIFAFDSGFRLFMPATVVAAVAKKLQMYKLRSRVEIELDNGRWQCIATTLMDGGDEINIPPDILRVAYGSRGALAECFGPTESVKALKHQLQITLQSEAWSQALIQLGIAVIDDVSSEKFTPHMLNLDKTGAISFDKGCYTGQEVVARTEHLGRSRRRLMHYRYDVSTIAAGDKLTSGAKVVGDVVNATSGDLLAVTPCDLHNQELTVNSAVVSPGSLPYSL